jgi:hypothetical protein
VEVLLFRQEAEADAVRAAFRVGALGRVPVGDHEADLEPPPWRYPLRAIGATAKSFTIDFADGTPSVVVGPGGLRAAVQRATVVVDLAGALGLEDGHIIAVLCGGALVPAAIARRPTERPAALLLAAWTLLRGAAFTQEELRRRVWLHAQRTVRGVSPTEGTELAVGTLRGYLSSIRSHVSKGLIRNGMNALGEKTHELAAPVALIRTAITTS